MNRLRSFRQRARLDRGRWGRCARSVYVLALAMLLLPLATGCSLDSGKAGKTTEAPTSMLVSFSTTTTMPGLQGAATTLGTTTTAPVTTTTTFFDTTTAPTTPDYAPTTVTLPPAETVLYEITDWSAGLNGWAAAGQWKTIAGMLVTDGTSDSFAVAPVDLGEQRNYAVECEIQIMAPDTATDVYLMARMTNGLGYWAGFNGENERLVIGFGDSDIADAHFALDGQWHKYRLEVYDNTMKMRFEEAELVRAMDNRSLEAGTVGIYCGKGQINVRAFRVVAL
jgi:hypothetical protein